jgi:small subunit ribosomal protein S10
MKTKNVSLIIKSINKDSLLIFKKFIINQISRTNINYKSFQLPTRKKRVTLLKSPHVNKSAREQFEIKYYKCFFQFSFNLDSSFIKFLFLNKPKTVRIQLKTNF